MSYTYGFFDAVDLGSGNYDRVYSSAEFSHYWALLVGDGVFGQPSTSLNVLATTPVAMSVKVSPGTGWIKGHYLTVPDNMDEVIAVPVANPSLPRIDSIIMALNNTDRDMKLYVRSGTAAASPKAVTLQRDADVWELELAQITVAAGAGNITQTAIKDMRTDPNRCGIVTGLIDQFDVSGFFTAAQASFDEWFDDIKTQLGDDVAGNLQNQINQLKEGKADNSRVEVVENQSYFSPSSLVLALSINDSLDSIDIGLGYKCAGQVWGVGLALSSYIYILGYSEEQYPLTNLKTCNNLQDISSNPKALVELLSIYEMSCLIGLTSWASQVLELSSESKMVSILCEYLGLSSQEFSTLSSIYGSHGEELGELSAVNIALSSLVCSTAFLSCLPAKKSWVDNMTSEYQSSFFESDNQMYRYMKSHQTNKTSEGTYGIAFISDVHDSASGYLSPVISNLRGDSDNSISVSLREEDHGGPSSSYRFSFSSAGSKISGMTGSSYTATLTGYFLW